MSVRKYGWRRDNPDARDVKFNAAKAVVNNLPASVDLRPNMPLVFDQGELGSCTSNATAGQVWFLDKTNPEEPSRLFIYYNTRVLEGTVNSDSGASIRNSIKSVVRYGFAPETLWPYDISKFKKKPVAAIYKKALTEKVTQYASVRQDPKSIKAALAQGFPVNFGFSVYESFESDAVKNTGKMPMPQKGERVLGGHAVLIVGYDDAAQAVIVRNSWGAGWGDKGYFYMPYEFLLNSDYASDFWVINAVP
jgi:C1A family cysteine protease